MHDIRMIPVDLIDPHPHNPRRDLDDWLVWDAGEHTCGGYGPESGYAHEPGCGYEPIFDLSRMRGWPGAERDALAAKVERVRALHQPINHCSPHLRTLCASCDCEHPCPTIRALDESEGQS